MSDLKEVTIYADGACLMDPRPGGYGVVIINGTYQKDLSGGYRITSNNRMEILAAVRGLVELKCCR